MRSPHPRALLAVASVAIALAAVDTYVVVLALTEMMAGVGISINALQRATPIISGFLLGYIAVLPLIGRLADLVDRQRVLLACLGVFTLGSAVTALAVDLPVLIAGRVLQGAGGGGLVPATLALVAALWPPGRRGTPLGVVSAVQEVGAVVGPVLGALILAWWQWRAIFWINAAAGVGLAVLLTLAGRARPGRPRAGSTLLLVVAVAVLGLALWAPEALTTSVSLGGPFVPLGGSESRILTPIGLGGLLLLVLALAAIAHRHREVLHRVDVPGALLLGGALAAVVLTFASAEPEREVVGPLGLALLPAAVVLALAFAWRQRRAAVRLIPAGVVAGRVPAALLVSLGVGVALVAVVVDVPLLARLSGGDETDAALVLVRFLIAVPLGALLGGWALHRIGNGVLSATGLVLAAAGLAAMSGWGRITLDTPKATLVLATVGFALGLVLAPINEAVLADTAHDAHALATALVVVARMTGMVLGVALLTAIGLRAYYQAVAALPDPTDTAALAEAAVTQVHWVFRGAALTAGAAALLALALGLRRRPDPIPR